MFDVRLIYMMVVVLGLSGCAHSTSLRLGEMAAPQRYEAENFPGKTVSAKVLGGNAQHLMVGEDVPFKWWILFKSEKLNRVIRLAMERNFTLAAAEAALYEARENYKARAGSEYFPQVDGNFGSSRLKSSPAAAGLPQGTKGSVYNLNHASVDLAYTFDIFGSGRRELEALRANIDYQRFQLEAAYITLTANIVTTVVREASLREQEKAMEEILGIEEKHLNLLEKQLELGAASRTEVLAQLSQLEQTRASLPAIKKDIAQTRHELMVLVGKNPSENADVPDFYLDDVRLPENLPISVPSLLVAQRPDIKASESLLKAASARVGMATADLYPKITLTGSFGGEAARLNNLFDPNNVVWNVGAGVVQPLFNGGRLRSQRRAAIAAFYAASANFRQTVLMAYANVADVLRALVSDAAMLQAQADSQKAAEAALDMTQQQFSVGAVNYIYLLNAQRQYQQARIGLIEARALRLSDTAALFQALGGGWWNRKETPAVKTKE